MKKIIKTYVVICLSLILICSMGCGNPNKKSTANNTNSIDQKSISKDVLKDENTKKYQEDKNVKIKTENDNNKDSNNKVVSKKLKENTVKSKELLKKDSNNSSIKSNQNVSKTSNRSKVINKSKEKNQIKQNNENIQSRDLGVNFTLMVSKNMKGKVGKESKILLKKQIEISGNKNAMTYLRENCTVIEDGGFIYAINGNHNLYPIPASKKTEEQKKNKILGIDWFIYLNGKKTSVGANDILPKKGDIIQFDFHEWDRTELSF